MKRKKGIIYTVIFTLIISFLFVFILSFTNEITKGVTERNEEVSFRKALLKVFNIPFKGDNEAFVLFENKIEQVTKSNVNLYTYNDENTTIYAILFTGMGLWGQVRGILTVNGEVSVIGGIEFLTHNETPGLGGRIDEESYKDQLRGELVGPGGTIRGTRNGVYDYDHLNSEIDGITGATRTSERIENIINQELARLRELLGKR